jgi:hypothetical protein
MAWTTNVLSTQFFADALMGNHKWKAAAGDGFKIALYNDSDTPAKNNTTYSTTNELATANGYTQGGVALTNADWAVDTTNNVAYGDFTNDAQWTTSTFTAYGAKIYNTTFSNKLVGSFWFNGAKSVSNGTFTVQMPAAAYNTAIVRITN